MKKNQQGIASLKRVVVKLSAPILACAHVAGAGSAALAQDEISEGSIIAETSPTESEVLEDAPLEVDGPAGDTAEELFVDEGLTDSEVLPVQENGEPEDVFFEDFEGEVPSDFSESVLGNDNQNLMGARMLAAASNSPVTYKPGEFYAITASSGSVVKMTMTSTDLTNPSLISNNVAASSQSS